MVESRRWTHLLGLVVCGVCWLSITSRVSRSEDAADARSLSELVASEASFNRGVCAIVLPASGDVSVNPVEVARKSELFVHVRCNDAARVNRVRQAARNAGFGIDRLAVEQGSPQSLPYADNLIDVLFVDAPSPNDESAPAMDEMLRVLRPRGQAIFVSREGDQVPQHWARQADDVQTATRFGATVTQFAKPPLAGAGNWSHWEHSPDNNPVSEDTVIKAPYLTQYLAHPSYIAMPAITTAAGGRTFLAIGHIAHHEREWDSMVRLIASNGYNGTVLWERKLPAGYMVHRSAFIATDDAFYMINGDHALVLDPETGEEVRELRLPGVEGNWKWMVLKNGVLYVLAGDEDAPAELVKGDRSLGGWSWADLSEGYYTKPHVPWGFGHTLAAYDLSADKVLWNYQEEKLIDSRSLSMGQDRMSIYSPDNYFRCLDLETGEVLWTNDDQETLELIEQPGQGLISTPGFRTACMTLFTPDALIVQGQTRNNVVALSTTDGYMLWTKKKVTNNPNAIYLDGNVILGVGERGNHVAVEPVSGEVVKNLNFSKRACTRLTACSDSLFVRGEGTLRFDRETGKVLIDGAARPACNDGALPANGMLYVGPWQCDCNLSLIGRLARCSAGDFRFDYDVVEEERLTRADAQEPATELSVTAKDWPTYRADNQRSSSSDVAAPSGVRPLWLHTPKVSTAPTAPTAAGNLVFMAGEDGEVKAFAADSGEVAWRFPTNSPIKYSPTVSEGRVYFGSGDGYAYCLEAATGKQLWRFRAAPVERHLMLYGHMASTWPVNSGVLVDDGVAYFAAGVIDSDGTYVYALDAETGKLRWQNNSSGHLNAELRKGVSVQGNLTIDGGRLLLAGGNQVSPAAFDLETGECLAQEFAQGQPKANNGRFAGLLAGKYPIVGGRILYSAPENVATKGSYQVITPNEDVPPNQRRLTFNFGGIPPAWDEQSVALVNFQNGAITSMNAEKVVHRIEEGHPSAGRGADARPRWAGLIDTLNADGAVDWSSHLGESNKFQAVAMVVCPNAVVTAFQQQHRARSQPQWYVAALDRENGRQLWRFEIKETLLPDGLLIDRDGRIVVTTVKGNVLCLGPTES